MAPILTVLLLTAMLASPQAQAQPALDSAAERQRELVEQIDAEQAANGLMSPGLVEPLTALALFYEENDDNLLATATTERVISILRDNYGLYSLSQAQPIFQLIRYAESRGDFQAAWNLEERLEMLAHRNPDSIDVAALWTYFGDLRMEMLERYVVGELPPRMHYGCYHDTFSRLSSCITGSREAAARAVLKEAHDYYDNAIDVLLRNDQYASEELEQLEMALVVSSFRYGRFLRPRSGVSKVREGPNGCERGLAALQRLHEYRKRNLAGGEERVNSLLQIGDAMLVCGQFAPASKTYREAWELAEREGIEHAAMQRIFAPDQPVALPTFLPNRLTVAESAESEDSVAVEFELTRFGLTRRVDLPYERRRGAAGHIRRLVRGQIYRPVIADGEVQDSPRFVVHYALAD